MYQLSLFGGEIELGVQEKPYHLELQQLYFYAKVQAMRWWNRKFDIEIKLTDARWRTQLGCYTYSVDNSIQPYIKMSTAVNTRLSEEEKFGTLMHEMVHWHLQTSGLPFRDTDEAFVLECMRVGAPFSGAKNAKKAASKAMNNHNITK